MEPLTKAYLSYEQYEAVFEPASGVFTFGYRGEKELLRFALTPAVPGDLPWHAERKKEQRRTVCTVRWDIPGSPSLVMSADRFGISFTAPTGAVFAGSVRFGDAENTFAMNGSGRRHAMRAALGPAVSPEDDLLFDRMTDRAIAFEGVRLSFDFDENSYRFVSGQTFRVGVKEKLYEERFGVPYRPVNKNNTYGALPPVGWMTWYAVKFGACEKTVLENARFQSEYLKDYGANTVWVDWEWYHKDFNEKSFRTDGVDSFHPDPALYPNGLKYVSDEIRKLGLIPALWIGFTNETFLTDYLKEHPEILLAEETGWVGTYFLDITHPTFLNDYLPKALAQVHDWGYDAIKFDTLPITIDRHEKYHERMYDPSLTTCEAFRGMIAKTRECLGENCYMLSCSGGCFANVMWASDYFDAARIGDDIFSWLAFRRACVEKVMDYYAMHNVTLYNDPDNVILRSEFNTKEQAESRASFVSLLGLPITFGDVLSDLDAERLNILRRAIPSLDIRPADVSEEALADPVLLTDLHIAKPWEDWHIAGVFNTTDEAASYTLAPASLGLGEGDYHVFDFWHKRYLGQVRKDLTLDLAPCETRVLAVRRVTGLPQIVSTNRHLTQGAAELSGVSFDGETMTLRASVVGAEDYVVYLYLPDGWRIADAGDFTVGEGSGLKTLTFRGETGEKTFKVTFEKENA